MPTTRARHQVTETPALARALDRAALRWPGESRSRLLLRLVDVGADVLDKDERIAEQDHRTWVSASSGAYADAFPTDYLTELRQDWPV